MRALIAIVVAAYATTAAVVGSAKAIEIQEVTTESGITAWLVEDHTVPLVAVDIAFTGAGAAQDPEGLAGRANLMASTIDEGAGDLDSAAFQTALQDNAVRLSFSAGRDHFYGDLRTLSSSVDEGFALLKLALTQPRFDQPAVDRVRAQVVSGLRRDEQDPDTVAARLWSRTVFPDHPYGVPTRGTVESVGAITRDDLVAAYDNKLARDNLVIAVVGAIDAETLSPLLDEAFAALPAESSLTPVANVQPKLDLDATVALPVPQTAIRLGLPGIMRDDPDFIPAFVMNHILGGGAFSSWLFQEVREKRGLAYSVYSFLAPLEHSAIFGAGTATSNAQADEATAVILEQMNRMAKEGPTAEQLDQAKDYLTGSYILRFSASGSIARQLLFQQIQDLGIDYVDRRQGLIEAVTLEDVRRVAERILASGAPSVAMAGGQPEPVSQ